MCFLKTQTDSGKLDKRNLQQIKPEGVEANGQSQAKDRSVDEHAYTHTQQISILAWKHHTSKKAAHMEIMKRVTSFISFHCHSLFSRTKVDSFFFLVQFFVF